MARTHEGQGLAATLRIGLLGGFVSILCCVSPVVLVLVGVVSAGAAVELGDTLYYDYGWYFRGAGALVAGVAIWWHLRRPRACRTDRTFYTRQLAILLGSGVAAYAGLFWFTKWLGIAFGGELAATPRADATSSAPPERRRAATEAGQGSSTG